MATRVGAPGPMSAPTEGDLARLLDTEAGLERALEHARDEATRLEAEARAAARAREEALGAEIEAEARRLAAEIAAERDRAAQAISEAARRDTERFDAVTPERIGELARRVVERVMGVAS